jgi:hypothetical protein
MKQGTEEIWARASSLAALREHRTGEVMAGRERPEPEDVRAR